MQSVDFYFDIVCPYAYLAHTQIEELCARYGAPVRWRPILLGGLFRSVRGDDGPMPGQAAARARMNLLDLHRFAEHWQVPLTMPREHPRRSLLAMRAIVASDDVARASKALFAAYWVRGEDVSLPEVVRAALDEADLDGAKLVARAGEQKVKDALRANTDEAAAAGAFGVPTFVIHRPDREPELHWGQDRMHRVAQSLALLAPPVVSFYFDYSSPFAYLAATQIEAVAKRHSALVRYRPFLLGGLFKAIGTPNVPLFAMSAAKQRFVWRDLDAWAHEYGVPFRFPSRFPMNTVTALRMTLELEPSQMGRLATAMFDALWVHDRDLNDESELVAIADAAGFAGKTLLQGCARAVVKEQLRAATTEAEAAGICGAPSFLVQTATNPSGTLFWGQDRLAFVEKALAGWRPHNG